jgi:hypothetical protein
MIDIKLFGTTVVDDGTSQVAGTALGGVKPRQLLEMLATELGNPLSKDLLAERLWEGKPPATYIATIESYVCVLRQHARLGRGRTAALATTTSGYLLDPEQVSVDLVQVRELCAEGAWHPRSGLSTWCRATCSPPTRTRRGLARSGRASTSSSPGPAVRAGCRGEPARRHRDRAAARQGRSQPQLPLRAGRA